ncbi:8345_t:CDS:2 [Scutellospora calospora]|uniref:8345_t:CDS:1 n=1 Tax=Scutellospora calospora TaxID=85575 RepID=A0ACA9JU66_9GLOM|nr:8345_t:CDS:2 [Scutellospora calospora]
MKEAPSEENTKQYDNKTENYDEIILEKNKIKEKDMNKVLVDKSDPINMVPNEISSKQTQTSSKCSVREEENLELIHRDTEKSQGIITINEGNKKEYLDPELVKLEKIPKFEPLIKPHTDSGFILGGLWGSTSQIHEKEPSFGYESLYNFSLIYQSYIKRCADEICEDQRLVMDTVKSVDEYCAQINQSITETQLQVKTNHEQISVVNGLIKQVEKTHKLVYEIFQTLNKLEKLIPEEGLFRDQNSKWPIIHKLYLTAKQKPSQGHTIKIPQRTNPSVVTVSQYNVLSEKHQDSDTLSPVKSTDWMTSNVQNIILGENTNSGRFKEILINPIREGFKRIVNISSINAISSSPEPYTLSKNIGTESLSISPTSLGLNLSNTSQSPTSGTVSLLTDMLKRSTSQKEEDSQNKISSKENKKKSKKSGIINKQTISESGSEGLLISTDNTRSIITKSQEEESLSDSEDEGYDAKERVIRPIMF